MTAESQSAHVLAQALQLRIDRIEPIYMNAPWRSSKAGRGTLEIVAPQPQATGIAGMSELVCMLPFYQPSAAVMEYLVEANPTAMSKLLQYINDLEKQVVSLKLEASANEKSRGNHGPTCP